MKKTVLTLGLAFWTALSMAQPPQNQGGRPPVPNGDSVRPMQGLFGPLTKRIQIHGYMQGGYDWKNEDEINSNTFKFRRTIVVAFAQITDRWSFFFQHDFNSEVQEFYTDFRVTKDKGLNVRIGQMKNSFCLENPYSPASLELVEVTSQATTFLAGTVDPLYANKVMYGRDQGLILFGELFHSHFKYELGVMNGQGININDKNNKKDLLAKLEYAPMPTLRFVASGQKGKGVAADYCWVNPSADFISPYNKTIKAGQEYDRDRWSFGAEYKSFLTTPTSDWTKRPLSFRAEIMGGKDGDVESLGGYATATIPLFATVDAVASYDFMNYNKTDDIKCTKLIFGLQYWFYKNCRVQLQYTRSNWENMQTGAVVVPNPMGPPTITPIYKPDFDMIQLQLQVGF